MSTKTLSVGMVAACGLTMMLSFVSGTYTCTNGTFDFSNFDSSSCFKLPEDDKTGSPGAGGGGGFDVGLGGEVSEPAAFTGDFPASAHFSECDGAVAIIKECRELKDSGHASVGVRWDTHMCKEHVMKYSIDIFSSADTDKRYRYITSNSPGKNSIIISSIPYHFHTDQNITIIVTPLDQYNKKISTGTEVVLDSESTYEICDSVGGNPTGFGLFREVKEAPPAPVNCTGGTWSAPGSCMSDDGRTVLTGEPGKCGAGITKNILMDYTPAQYGGTCNTEKGTRCYVPCPSEEPADCVLAKYPQDHPTLPGSIAWNPAPGTPDYNYMCCHVEPKGKVFQSADVLEDAQGNGKCNYTQEITCSCPT